jgi:hypothetical protein
MRINSFCWLALLNPGLEGKWEVTVGLVILS